MIEQLIPNVVRYHESLIKATADTLIMVAVSSVIEKLSLPQPSCLKKAIYLKIRD